MKYNFSSVIVGVEFSEIFRGVVYPETNNKAIMSIDERVFLNMDKVLDYFVNSLGWNGKDKNTPGVYSFNGSPGIIGLNIETTNHRVKLDENVIQESKQKIKQLLLNHFSYSGEISIFVTSDYWE